MKGMPLNLYSLLEAGLLFVNAIAILHRQRFLAKIGFANNDQIRGFGDPEGGGVKSQIVNLIFAVQTVMRVPLIFINVFVICVKLVVG